MTQEDEVPHSSVPQCLYLGTGVGAVMTTPYTFVELPWSVQPSAVG